MADNQSEVMTPPDPTTAFPDPRAKQRRADISGIEIEIAGYTWKLAEVGLVRSLTAERDQIFNDNLVYQDAANADIQTCAWQMLQANYNLTPEETAAVIFAAPIEDLFSAVTQGIFVHQCPEPTRSYTNWARSALLANGLDPAKVSKADMPHVLRQLVVTKRAIPLTDFTAAGEYLETRASILGDI